MHQDVLLILKQWKVAFEAKVGVHRYTNAFSMIDLGKGTCNRNIEGQGGVREGNGFD